MIRCTAIIILMLVGQVFGQRDTIRIPDFSLGTNTAYSDFLVPPGAGRICHNVDISDGALTVRDGYDSVYHFPGSDSIVGLAALKYSWGEKQLIAVVDSAGVGWGNVYVSVRNSSDFGSKIDSVLLIPDTTGRGTGVRNFWDTIYTATDTSAILFQLAYAWPMTQIVDSFVAKIGRTDCTAFVNIYDLDSGYALVEKTATTNLVLKTDPYQSKYQYDRITGYPTHAYDYFPIQSKPSFAQFDDRMYIVPGGDGRGIIYNGEMALPFPLQAPGEPLIVPILDTGGSSAYTLDGEYYYAFRFLQKHNADTIHDFGIHSVIAEPIKVKDGRVLLRKFQEIARDGLFADSIPVGMAEGDTVVIQVLRTTGNPGAFSRTTKLYNTGLTLKVSHDSCFTGSSTFTSLALAYMIDSIPDTSAFADTIQGVVDSLCGRDSLGVLVRRYGAPAYISGSNAGTYTAADTLSDSVGIFIGVGPQKDTLGMAYYVALHDTLSGALGPLSAPCCVFNDTNDIFRSITIGLPRIPAGDSGIVINVYRSLIYQVGYMNDSTDLGVMPDWMHNNFREWYKQNGKWVDAEYAVDTVVILPPRFLVQLPATDTIYGDSVRQDSLDLKKMYPDESPPTRLKQIQSYDNRLFGYYGSYACNSRTDSAQAWSLWNITPIDRDNGDQITGMRPGRTAMRIFENYSSYNIYDDYGKPEIVSHRGCIAPYSQTAGALYYYLSTRGIEGEVDGQYLERTVNGQLVSGFLNNFKSREFSDLNDMVGFYLPTKQTAMFSLGDTSWVLSEEAWLRSGQNGGFSTSSMTFAGGCLYDTDDELAFTPGQTFYFFKDGGDDIYTYGTSTLDNGDSIQMIWESAPIGVPGRLSQLVEIGLGVKSSDSADSAFTLLVYDELGNAMDSVFLSDLNTRRYLVKQFPIIEAVEFFKIRLRSNVSVSNTVIDRLDIVYDYSEDKQQE